MIYQYNKILFSKLKGVTTDTQNNLEESQKYYEWVKELRSKRVHIVCSIYMKALEKIN